MSCITSIAIMEKSTKQRAKEFIYNLIENIPLERTSKEVFNEMTKIDSSNCNDEESVYLSHIIECYSIICETHKECDTQTKFNFIVKEKLNKYFEL